MIGTLVTLLVGLLIIGVISYVAHEFAHGRIVKLIDVVCVILAILLVVYCIIGFANGAGASVG